MDIHFLVPPAFHEKLKCYLCKNYLSHFPISVCSNNESVCGRCTVPEGRISCQDEAFETICQFLKFPCRYRSEGCPEEIAPKDVPQHEENCSYRVVSCFITKPVQCKWKGSLPTLLPHCRTEHSDIILENGEFQMDLALSETTENLIEHGKQLLIFNRKFEPEDEMLHCAIYHSPYQTEIENFPCQLSITSDNKNLLLNFNTTSYKEMILSCLCLKAIICNENGTDLLCKITIENAESEHQDQQIGPEANLQLLSLLKCCKCSNFAIPLTYQCVGNLANILCKNCKRSHRRSCRSCNTSGSHLRNFRLEKIADLVSYPCQYRQNGCSQSYEYRVYHPFSCEYRDDICPFFEFDMCKWKGLNKDICDHVVINHGEIMLESSEIALVLSLEMKTPQCNIIRYSNRLFRLVFWVDQDECYIWSVEMIGFYENNFYFALDIVDTNDGNKRLLKSQHCGRLSKKDILFRNRSLSCYFLNDQICHFSEDLSNRVTFNVHIFK